MAVLSEDQVMLRDAAQGWVTDKAPIDAARKLRDDASPTGFDPAAFAEMAAMGWAGVIVPEEYGGAGFDHLSFGVILEALGRTLTPSPLVSTALAAVTALRAGGNRELAEAWLPRIAAGEAVVALAVDETSHHAPTSAALAATRDGEEWRLDGVKRNVRDGMAADALLVVGRVMDGGGGEPELALFMVPADAPGVSRVEQRLVDGSVVASVRLDDVRLARNTRLGNGFEAIDHVLDAARVGLAAEMLGAAEQAFAVTLDYLKIRVQFGQVIGSFQALQHRAADLYGELALMRSVVERALSALDTNQPDRPLLASLAKLFASQTFRRAAGEMIQMHGGIGMTEEHDAGLYLRRAQVAAAAYGGEAFHRERYGRLTGH